MALAKLCLAKAEAVGAAVRVAGLKVELALLASVTGVALHVGLAETGRRGLVTDVLGGATQVTGAGLALWVVVGAGRAVVAGAPLDILLAVALASLQAAGLVAANGALNLIFLSD